MQIRTDDQEYQVLVESINSVDIKSKEEAERLLREKGLNGFKVIQESNEGGLKVVRILLG